MLSVEKGAQFLAWKGNSLSNFRLKSCQDEGVEAATKTELVGYLMGK